MKSKTIASGIKNWARPGQRGASVTRPKTRKTAATEVLVRVITCVATEGSSERRGNSKYRKIASSNGVAKLNARTALKNVLCTIASNAQLQSNNIIYSRCINAKRLFDVA